VKFNFDVGSDGSVAMVRGMATEFILIANDWQKYYDDGETNKGGYIAKGWAKIAIRVCCLSSSSPHYNWY